MINRVPPEDKLLVLGNCSARVGTDYTTYASIISRFNKGRENTYGDFF